MKWDLGVQNLSRVIEGNAILHCYYMSIYKKNLYNLKYTYILIHSILKHQKYNWNLIESWQQKISSSLEEYNYEFIRGQ